MFEVITGCYNDARWSNWQGWALLMPMMQVQILPVQLDFNPDTCYDAISGLKDCHRTVARAFEPQCRKSGCHLFERSLYEINAE